MKPVATGTAYHFTLADLRDVVTFKALASFLRMEVVD